MSKLHSEAIAKHMAQHPQWRLKAPWLARDIQFKTFAEAWRFMTVIAEHAEAQDHHPNWYNVYGTVKIRLSSLMTPPASPRETFVLPALLTTASASSTIPTYPSRLFSKANALRTHHAVVFL